MSLDSASQQIHVVHIIPTLNFGGAERLVVDLVNNCDKIKFKFSIIVLSNQKPLETEISGAPVYIVPKRGKLSFHLRKDLRNKLQELKPDIVHTHLFGADLWGRLAARDLGLPVVTTEHNLNYDYGCWRTLVRKVMKNYSKKYVACSDAVAEYMRQKYNIKQDKITVIKNGVRLDKFTMPVPVWQEPMRFVLIGRLTKQKGQEIVLRALSHLKHLSWSLNIVGQGEDEKKLKQITIRLGLEEKIRFISPQKDIAKVLSEAQVVLMPSLWEGLGVVAMETMSAGRLVIASNTGGLKEIIASKKTGLLVKPGDINEWTKILDEVINNLGKFSMTAISGQNFAQANFSLKKTIVQYEKLYSEVLA